MTGPVYELTTGGLIHEFIDWRRAHELYEKNLADHLRNGLAGNLDAGFGYWVVDAEGIQLVRVRVELVG